MELIGKSQTIQEQETCFLHLIEETQLDLIWHPDRREKCEITFTHGHREIEVYVYREDCPMSAFREYAMFLLFMVYADCLAINSEDWKPAAARALKYLRKLPDEVRDRSLAFAYTRIAHLYEASGDPKAEWSRKQAELCRLYADGMTPRDAASMMETMEDDKLFDFCLYVLRYIVEQGCFGEDAFYLGWKREQYELVEFVLDKAVEHFAHDEGNTILNRSFFYFLKGIYLKRTRRFKLAEAVWKAYLELPRIEEEACFTPSLVHALWGECCLHRMEEALAKEHFRLVREDEDPLVWEYVQSLLAKENVPTDELNQALLQTVTDACCQNNVTPQSLKESIDAFFAPPEMDDEEEEQDEEVDGEGNGEEECAYTFDQWYDWAEEGDRFAQLVVGFLYYKGEAVSQNYRLAREWFYLSAFQGNAAAQMNLAYMYAHGYGVEADGQEAARWREKAVANPSLGLKSYKDLLLR